jgi:RHS repeat-associated protein
MVVNATTFVSPASPSFYAWGGQLEGQPFPTSYIPTSNGSATRAADVLNLSSIPSWMTSGQWQLDVAPLFASYEMRSDWRYSLVSFSATTDIALVAGSNGSAKLSIRHSGGTYTSPDIAFDRSAVIRLTFDLAADRLTIAGNVYTGDGTYAVPGFAFGGSTVRIGGAIGGQSEAFAALSEPRQVAAPTATCTADAACSCGNGVLDAGEVCDPGLNAHCTADCTEKGIVLCAVDADCPAGALCGDRNGAAFGQSPQSNVCWPAGVCTTNAASNCGPGAACGDCVCVPNCAQAACGASTSDGCGGICRGACAGNQPGCTNDDECAPGYACGEAQGEFFGLGAGTNICWREICNDQLQRKNNCGTPGAVCGSTCPVLENKCGFKVCGLDQNKNSCGVCPDGEECTPDGACQAPLLAFTEPPPEALALADVIDDPQVDPVGSLQGDFSVDANGAATYTIPIDVPPGRAGHTPKLALQYNSGSGDGFVGKGWSLTGLSAITRCPRTFAQHGYAKGVELSEDDALCLDGKLLIEVPNETGVREFRTELDSFVRVRAFGEWNVTEPGPDGADSTWHTGPDIFEVVTKEGLRLVYGTEHARVDARFNTDSTSYRYPVHVTWLLRAIGDVSGNSIFVSYDLERHTVMPPTDRSTAGFRSQFYTGEVRPTTISYGHDRSHQIAFEYDEHDVNHGVRNFRAGVGRHFASPIRTITTSIGPKKVRIYRLQNELRGNEWLLTSIAACAPHSSGERCLPATTFGYAPTDDNLHLLATTTDDAGHIPTHPNYKGRVRDVWEPENADQFHFFPVQAEGNGRDSVMHFRFNSRGRRGTNYRDPGLNPDRGEHQILYSMPLTPDGHAFRIGPKTNAAPLGTTDFNADGIDDGLGRKSLATTPDGRYDYTYDTPGDSSVGHLVTASVTSSTIGNVSTTYEYNNPGAAVSAIRRTIDGETFNTLIEPDELGRIGVIRYPAQRSLPTSTDPPPPPDPSFAIRYRYEANYGRLDAVRNDANGESLWSLLAIDGFGNATSLVYANGQRVTRSYDPVTGKPVATNIRRQGGVNFLSVELRHDERGLLETRTTREDNLAAQVESFEHDAMARITQRTRVDGAIETFGYDDLGNLLHLPGVGTLSYDQHGPHQVSRTEEGRTFDYVAGNQVARSGASVPDGHQRIDYTAFDLPYRVASGPDEQLPVSTARFHYDASNKRAVQIKNDGSRVFYAGELYRRTIAASGAVEHAARIPTPDGLVIEAELQPSGQHRFKFLQTDYLGSVLSMADGDGTRIGNTAAYSPFGVPTNPVDSWSAFTSHESDDDLGLINMKGRMYDPQLGRFLTADPIVANPLNSQNWNRYSYVSNSPLNAIDPSGFEEDWGSMYSSGNAGMSTASTVMAGTTEASMGASSLSSTPFMAEGGMTINGSASYAEADESSPAFSGGDDPQAHQRQVWVPLPARSAEPRSPADSAEMCPDVHCQVTMDFGQIEGSPVAAGVPSSCCAGRVSAHIT